MGPLAGVPFAAKNLFDIAGLPTLAGSKINRDRAPATADATLIERLEAAGAILVGALNMGEYAYDFTGENVHDGPSRNPHDTARMTGGSSSGSGGAVAGGLVPLSLGSDTNGSIRVPSSFCGLFGLKPTYGRLSRARSFPFRGEPRPSSGRWRASARDLALAYDAMQGHDPGGPGLRGAPRRAGAARTSTGAPPACASPSPAAISSAMPRRRRWRPWTASPRRSAPPARSRSRKPRAPAPPPSSSPPPRAPPCISTGCAPAPRDFDPAVRDRLIAGAMVPASLVVKAQKFRRWYHAAVLKLFDSVDAILAPATPCPAPRDRPADHVARRRRVAGPAQYRHLHPADLVHRPAGGGRTRAAAPLPIGVQIIAAPWREDVALRIAHALEKDKACPCAEAAGKRPHDREEAMEIDLPEVVAEVRAAFERYEQALVSNDVATLDALFREDARTIRYGVGENLYGHAEIASFRVGALARGAGAHPVQDRDHHLRPGLRGRLDAVPPRSAPGRIGRQMQTWVRFPEGWRVVAAHVSIIADPTQAAS